MCAFYIAEIIIKTKLSKLLITSHSSQNFFFFPVELLYFCLAFFFKSKGLDVHNYDRNLNMTNTCTIECSVEQQEILNQRKVTPLCH